MPVGVGESWFGWWGVWLGRAGVADRWGMSTRTIIVGTRETAALLARQLRVLPQSPELVGAVVLDGADGPSDDVEILGDLGSLVGVCASEKVVQAIVTLPAHERGRWRGISADLRRAGIVERFVTPMDEVLNSAPAAPASIGVERPGARIDLARLVGREAHGIDRELVSATISGKTVLVTGAGGSIGSELVRQCASLRPKRIVLMERAENALFGVDRYLNETYPEIERAAILHDVVDAPRTLSLVERWSPDVVFHAAAHKHVPLMEDHPAHAVTNNVFGTKAIADACVSTGVERFVLISSDKAVNPVNVMGATKRLAEMYVQSLAAGIPGSTKLSMVRFGNVLGSACSVLEIWSDQVGAGRPITVTDERMTRYFMTIPEAATLVIQAGAMSGDRDGRSGEVFVLDMGDPINIFQLAQRFVRACGCEPMLGSAPGEAHGPDRVPIIITGARPGEKLYEELSYADEDLSKTAHPGIARLIDRDSVVVDAMDALIEKLDTARRSSSRHEVVNTIASVIPSMETRAAAGAA